MNVQDNPKAQEFLSWVRELHGEETSDRCRSALLEHRADDFVPLVVLNDVLQEMHHDDVEALVAIGEEPFDSD